MKDFVGHDEIISAFEKQSINSSISHAYLIIGEDGLGKSILANEFAKNILNIDFDKNHVDIVNFKNDKTFFGVDEVRSIIEEVHKKPFNLDKKVIIIYNYEKMTIQAQNALLKTIEEPPLGVYIILLCENSEDVLDTIKSRCQICKLHRLSKEKLIEYINKHYSGIDYNLQKYLIAFCDGIPGEIDKYMNQKQVQIIRDKLIYLIDLASKNKLVEILELEEFLVKNKDYKYEILKFLISLLRDIIVYRELADDNNIINLDKLEYIKEFSINISYIKIENMIKKVEDMRLNLKNNISWSISLRIMLTGFLEV